MKIAAFVDTDGNTQSFDSSGIILVFTNENSRWNCIEKVPFYINNQMNLKDVRKSIYSVAPNLMGCMAFIVKRGVGIFNAIFEEELHIRVFSAKGSPALLLDQVRDAVRSTILEAIKAAEHCKERNNPDNLAALAIRDLSNGCYQINLVKVQEGKGAVSSKDILLPFFREKQFVELEIICTHTPKWIERELVSFNFNLKTERRKNGLYHVFVYPVFKE